MKTGDQRTATNDGDDGGNNTHEFVPHQRRSGQGGAWVASLQAPLPSIPPIGGLGYRSICYGSVKITLFARGGDDVCMDHRGAGR